MMAPMAHLATHLTVPDARPAVVTDACALLDQEVGRASGVSGLAVRSAYRVLAGVRPGMVASAVDRLLDPFADRLDPFYQEHLATGVPLADVLSAQRAGMADALLAITDDRAQRTSNRTLRAAYRRVRGTAKQYVGAAAPGIAGLIEAHAPVVEGRTAGDQGAGAGSPRPGTGQDAQPAAS
jgi:hypothetical protein